MKSRISSVCLAAACVLVLQPALAQEKKTGITLDTAQKIAAGCRAKATAEGWKMNIAVVDDGGNLKYFERMDGAFRGSIQVAQLKAGTSSMFPFSTKQVGEITQKYVPGLAYVPGVVTFEGGLPIKMASGEQIGAVGVSGASAEQDGACAQAGLDAVKDLLK